MPNKKLMPWPLTFVTNWTLPLPLVAFLLAGCAKQLQPLPPPPSQGVRLTPLPSSARQPTPPPECLPTCTAGLTRERDSSRELLTNATSPAAPVSGSPMKP